MNICLIGPRGVGKTRAARRLAILLRRPVVSTDVLVAYECGGKTVAALIRKKGGGAAAWKFFREKEYAVLRKISGLKDVIVDCGGGIVVDIGRNGMEKFSARKVKLLRKKAVVVWLKSDIGRILKKIGSDPRRPRLSSTQDVRAIMRRRRPFYARAAHLAVPTRDDGAKILAERVLQKIRKRFKTV